MNEHHDTSQPKQKELDNDVNPLYAILVLLVSTGIFMLVFWNYTSLPTPLTIQDENNYPNQFIAERSYKNLENLVSHGPRVAGSKANEKFAVDFLKETIQDIIANKHSSHNIEIDHQIVELNDFSLGDNYGNTNYGLTSVYRSLQNIVVKVTPKNSTDTKHSILLNAHFDSVPTSPGAGDDGSMTVVMLEILRVLSKAENAFKHAFIFLFNGSEENLLQGAHAFIKNHKWANTIRAFINMDSAGCGGREIMFQAGPKHPWLMNYYGKYAKHPYASALGEELFQSNFIPSDTDYRQFRDFGGIPGYDFAYNTKGYKYHTKYDSLDSIDQGSLQHTGDNILELIKALGNADEIENTQDHKDGNVVFYDYLNWFMVTYTDVVGTIINSIFSGLVIVSIFVSIVMLAKRDNIQTTIAFQEFGFIIIAQTITVVISTGVVLMLAVMYDAVGRSLSWLSSTWLLYGLYFCPLFFSLSIGPFIYIKCGRRICKLTKNGVSLAHIVQMFIHAQVLFLTVITIALTIMNTRSAYISMISVLFYMIFNTINILADKYLPLYRKINYSWIFVHFLGVLFPFLYYCSLALTAFATFIPIQARSNPASNPEIIICLLCVLLGVLLSGQLLPIILLCRKRVYLYLLFLIITLISVIIMFTPVGFPYREKTAPQRYFIHHIEQKFHDSPGVIKTGFYFNPMDRHAFDYIDEFLEESKFIPHNCTGKIYCGYPHYHSSEYSKLNRSKLYALSELDKPVYNVPAHLTLTNILRVNDTVDKYSFSLSGPDHMSLYVTSISGIKITSWNLKSPLPRPNKDPQTNRDLYYIAFIYGNFDNRPFEIDFYLERDASFDMNDNKLEIGVVGQYMHQESDKTKVFTDFLDTFPKYSVQYNWVSTYQSYVFK